MKEKNNIEQFDNLFKQQLENASVQPPVGLFEAMSSSIGSAAAVAKVSLLNKLFVGAILVSGTAIISYYLVNDIKKIATNENIAIKITNINSDEQPANNDIVLSEPQLKSINKKEIGNLVKSAKPKAIVNEPTTKKVFNDNKSESVEEKNSINNYTINTNDLPKSNEEGQILTPKVDSEIVEQLEPAHVKAIDSSYIFIPNAVTPNGDGLNDEYLIDIKGEDRVQIIIFDKNLNRLFETKNKSIAWQCTLPNGEIAPNGDYIVKVIYTFKNKDQQIKTVKLKLIK